MKPDEVQRIRALRKKVRVMRAALREIASERCTYRGHNGNPDRMDWDCPGEVCTAKRALKVADEPVTPTPITDRKGEGA